MRKYCSAKVLTYLNSKLGAGLPKKTTWETAAESSPEEYTFSLHVNIENVTTMTIHKNGENVFFANLGTECFDRKCGDWNWDFVYEYYLEWIVKNVKIRKTRKNTKKT